MQPLLDDIQTLNGLLLVQEGSSVITAKTWPRIDYGTDHELLFESNYSGRRNVTITHEPKHVSAIFKKNIKNHFTVLKLIDREPERLWNETKVAVKDEYEKKLPETKNIRKQTGCQKQ